MRHTPNPSFSLNKTRFQQKLKQIQDEVENLSREMSLAMSAERVLKDTDFNEHGANVILGTTQRIAETAKTVVNLIEGYHNR